MNNQKTDCERDTTPQALLSIDEALELLLNSAKVSRSTQWLGLDESKAFLRCLLVVITNTICSLTAKSPTR
jgi:hypothetical protein